jgi:hypothetical protein
MNRRNAPIHPKYARRNVSASAHVARARNRIRPSKHVWSNGPSSRDGRYDSRATPSCSAKLSERVWLVTFMRYDLGYFDDETCRLEPIENPFAPKLLPMSPE